MKLIIKATGHSDFELILEPSTSILELKNEVKKITGLEVDEQRLVHGGRVLQNDSTLESCGLQDGDVIYVAKQAKNKTSNSTENEQLNSKGKLKDNSEASFMKSMMSSPFVKVSSIHHLHLALINL